MTNRYLQYLQALKGSFKKLAKIEFLQPDNSVAFALDNNYKRGFRTKYDTRAFIQGGTLSVTLQNGQRRRASITLSNLDGRYDYAINKIWFGQRIRLLMGLELPDGTDFYLSQGVFYISNPSTALRPNQRTTTYNLVDKWSYLDGSLFGSLNGSYTIDIDLNNGSLWRAMSSVLTLDRTTFTNDNVEMPIDNVTPVFTTFYNDKTGNEVQANIPYDILISGDNSTVANILLELNNVVVGWIGYDQTGALRVDASQNDIEDNSKPVLWEFTPNNSQLLGITETFKNSEVYNEVIISGQNLEKEEIFGVARNLDALSDTNINIIGRRTYRESQPNFSKVQQCVDLAQFRLKRKTVLQKSITIESSQIFHLIENNLITVVRTDKEGSPTERHLINSFTLPIGETGQMSINCTSVNDTPNFTVEVSPTPPELQLPAPTIAISGDTLQITDNSGGLATSFDILVDGVVMASVLNEAEEVGTEGLTYTLINNDTEYEVSGYTGTDTEVVTPSMYNGLPVTYIGEKAFYQNTSITKITIANSVTNIIDRAFWDCSSLKSVTIGDSVTFIGNQAFKNCSSLTSVTIPNNVTTIGAYAFDNCSSLTSIEIPDSVTYIGDRAFIRCSSLTTIYCEYELKDGESKPSGWNSYWNYGCDAEVIWGYKPQPECCFVAGTPILMADGTTKAIETVVVGDEVLTYNEETFEYEKGVVVGLITKTKTIDMARVNLKDRTAVEMNAYHPLYTQDGWKSLTGHKGMPILKESDLLLSSNGEYIEILSIERWEEQPPIVTYNLNIEDNDNFFVGETAILAHNDASAC